MHESDVMNVKHDGCVNDIPRRRRFRGGKVRRWAWLRMIDSFCLEPHLIPTNIRVESIHSLGPSLDLDGRLQSIPQGVNQVPLIFKTGRDADALLLDAQAAHVLPLVGLLAKDDHVVGKHDGDVPAEVRAGVEAAAVVKGRGALDVAELDRQEAPVARLRQLGRGPAHDGVVLGLARQETRVLHVDDDDGRARSSLLGLVEEPGHGESVAVQHRCALEKVVRVGQEHLGVRGEELVAVRGLKHGPQDVILGGQGVEDDGAAHDVGPAAKGLCEGRQEEVGLG